MTGTHAERLRGCRQPGCTEPGADMTVWCSEHRYPPRSYGERFTLSPASRTWSRYWQGLPFPTKGRPRLIGSWLSRKGLLVPNYGHRTTLRGSGLAFPYGITLGLVVCACLGAWWVAGYALVSGPLLGWWWARRSFAANDLQDADVRDAGSLSDCSEAETLSVGGLDRLLELEGRGSAPSSGALHAGKAVRHLDLFGHRDDHFQSVRQAVVWVQPDLDCSFNGPDDAVSGARVVVGDLDVQVDQNRAGHGVPSVVVGGNVHYRFGIVKGLGWWHVRRAG